jgi:regulator of ribonuclease activity A
MYARSLTDRLKMQMEILTENFTDFIRRHSLRTPLIVMAGVAVVMTLKNGRQTIEMIKSLSGSPFSSSNSAGFYSPYGRTAGSSYGGVSNQYGAGSSRQQQYGTNYASSQMNSPYGQQQQQQQQQQQYGGHTPQNNLAYGMNNGIGSGSSQSYGGAGNLRGTAATSTGTYPSATTGSYGNTAGSYGSASSSGAVSTASLIANYGTSVQSVQPGLLHDFTSVSSFSGQIETISAPDAPGFVEQMLRSTPGTGKVLVIDGGGTMNALFDSNMATLAQQNGWKGVIINGFVLDPQALMMKQVGVKALGSNPSRGMQMMGQRGVPVTVAGVMFSPGSWVYVDSVSMKTGFHLNAFNQIAISLTIFSTKYHISGWNCCKPTKLG